MEQLIFFWANVQDYSAASRGGFIDDGRKVFSIEAFLEGSFIQSSGTNEGTSNPGPNASAVLMKAFDSIADYVGAGILLQSTYGALIGDISIAYSGGVSIDVSKAVSQLQGIYAQNPLSELVIVERYWPDNVIPRPLVVTVLETRNDETEHDAL